MQPSGPYPINAFYSTGTGLLTVEWSEPLVTASSAIGNWRADISPPFPADRYDNTAPGQHYLSTSLVFMTVTNGGSQPPTCTYRATPPDAVSLATGIPAAPFANFPLSIVP